MEIMSVNSQWRSRPADQRFTSLLDLHSHTAESRANSKGVVVSSRALRFEPADSSAFGGIHVIGQNGKPALPTHWAFGQLSRLARNRDGDAPHADFLRGIPTPIACDVLNYGFQHGRDIEDVGVLLSRNPESGDVALRAATGPKYGRIWNSEIASELIQRFGDGVSGDWRVPGIRGTALESVTKENTTLYAGDRDMFVFLADEQHKLDMPNRRDGKPGSLSRGFFVWNSETGSGSLGAAFFLFDYVCGNRIIWGVQQFQESRIRHTVSAPHRWLEEISPVLEDYSQSAAKPVLDHIAAAQARKVDKLGDFLASRFSKRQSAAIQEAHKSEEGRPIESLWDVATGITAFAKTVPFQDSRVALEREAGKVLALAA